MSCAIRRAMHLLAACSLLVTGQAFAAIPASWQFTSILDRVTATGSSLFVPSYQDQQLSIGTHLNANGSLIGFWLKQSGEFHTYSLRFPGNPQMQVLDTPGFIGLTGGDITCWWIFCGNEYAYGIRVLPPVDPATEPTAVTAFVSTPAGSVAEAGSLPFALFPGNFVDENRRGIVASTQVTATGQYGVIIHGGGTATLADIPWVIAINDLSEPLVLAYDGAAGDCLVYGKGCAVPVDCDADGLDDHTAENGKGHEEHGRGWGYGHDKCSDGDSDGNVGDGNDGPRRPGGAQPEDSGNGSLLVRLRSDGSTVRYRFPSTVAVEGATLSQVFPLALNDNRAVLRGTVTVGSTRLDKRLLSCVFDGNALDGNADGIVDCSGGLTLIGGIDGSIRAGTVLGFTLNSAGLLAGNVGFSPAGVGTPFILDLTAPVPSAVSLVNLATNTEGWELNELTDLNGSNMLTGYGYRDCSSKPQAFMLTASTTAPASALRFVYGAFESPALLASNESLLVTPQVTGATGSVEYRVWQKTPADTAWSLLQDWSASTALYDPAGFTGQVCFKVQARDSALPDAVHQQVVRYLVTAPRTPRQTDQPPDESTEESPAGGDPAGVASLATSEEDFSVGDLLGAGSALWLMLLLPLGLRRRR